MSFFKRLGQAASAFGQEMNKGVWITAVKQAAWSLDSRSIEWHERAPEAVSKAAYDQLWEELGRPSMRFPRDLHVRIQTACAHWANGFFSAYFDAIGRGEAVNLHQLIATSRSKVHFNEDFTPKA